MLIQNVFLILYPMCYISVIPFMLDQLMGNLSFLRIHIMEMKENKYFMYNSFQLKKDEQKMFNDSIIMFIRDCIQIIVYNNMECCMYPTCWIALPQVFFLSLKVSDIISGFLYFNIL